MKKVSLLMGAALIATVGGIFADWSFHTSTVLEGDKNNNISIGVDTNFEALGRHGTFAVDTAAVEVPNLMIVQNEAKTGAVLVDATTKAAISDELVYTISYTEPEDIAQNPDPEEWSTTINVVTSINFAIDDVISCSSTAISVTLSRDGDTKNYSETVRVTDLLAKISFAEITTEKAANNLVTKFNGVIEEVETPKITFTFSDTANA